MAKHWRYCMLCRKAITYTPDVFEMEEKVWKELDIRMEEHQLNLCRTCKNDFPTCDGDPEFGNCVGDDNVVACGKYGEADEARW